MKKLRNKLKIIISVFLHTLKYLSYEKRRFRFVGAKIAKETSFDSTIKKNCRDIDVAPLKTKMENKLSPNTS